MKHINMEVPLQAGVQSVHKRPTKKKTMFVTADTRCDSLPEELHEGEPVAVLLRDPGTHDVG